VIERGLLRFMYAKDEVVILLVTYALFLVLEDVIKLIWGVNPYFVAEPYALLGSFEVGGLKYPTYNLICRPRPHARRRARLGAARDARR